MLSIRHQNLHYMGRALVKGILAGIVIAAFILLTTVFTNFIWQTMPSYIKVDSKLYILGITIFGGILIGLLQKYASGYPESFQELFQDTTLIQNYKTDFSKIFVMSLIILSFGGSVGPEAPVAGLIVALFQWMKVDFNQLQLGDFKINKSNKFITDFKQNFRYTKAITLIAALLSFFFTFKKFNQNKGEIVGLYRNVSLNWSWHIIYLLPIGILVGVVFGEYFKFTDSLTSKLVSIIKIPSLYQPILGGIILGIVGIYSMDFLFSGANQLVDISHNISKYSIGFLILLALGKPLLTNLGFKLGWRGGTIFPAILSSFAFAFVFSNFIGLHSGLFLLVISLSATMFITGSPFIMALVYMFLYSFDGLPVIIVVTFIMIFVQKLLKGLKRMASILMNKY